MFHYTGYISENKREWLLSNGFVAAGINKDTYVEVYFKPDADKGDSFAFLGGNSIKKSGDRNYIVVDLT